MSVQDPISWSTFARAVRAKIARDLQREAREAEARRAQVLSALRKAIGRARQEGLCGQAWLVGSYAWGQPGARSDVDVLLEGCLNPTAAAVLIGEHCMVDVHVLRLENAPESLRERVLAAGVEL